MNYNAALTSPSQSKPLPASLLPLPEDDKNLSLRVRFNALLFAYSVLNAATEDPRWITVVTAQPIDRQSYKALFGDKSRLRIIQAKAEDLLWITWQCLAQGNSYAVITTIDNLPIDEQQQLHDAAAIGNCTFHQV